MNNQWNHGLGGSIGFLPSAQRPMRLAVGAFALAGLMVTASAQTTVRASVSSSSAQVTGNSPQGSISGDGRYVVFTSFATDVTMLFLEVPIDVAVTQVYKRDLLLNTTELVSVNAFGFAANANNHNPRISPNGRYVSFSSDATNLDGADNNGSRDIYRRDTISGSTIRVSVADNEEEGNGTSDSSAITADGNLVVFRSHATNMVPGDTTFSQVFIRDVLAGTTTLASKICHRGGRRQRQRQLHAVDYSRRTLCRLLVESRQPGNWRHERELGRLPARHAAQHRETGIPADQRAQYFGISHTSAISDNGRYVAFASINSFNIADANGTYDVFLRDTVSNTLTRMSDNNKGKSSNGASGDSEGWGVRIIGDGLKVVFESNATDLVTGDANGV